jgi:hypothetical protein
MYTAHSVPVAIQVVFGAIVVIALLTILLFALVAGTGVRSWKIVCGSALQTT